ncbi:MAG: transcriptional regulator [Blastocatellia bacterium]|nr:transcriptional regulator [Blastocatellia bacterium]
MDSKKYGRLLARALPVVIETEEDNERMLGEAARLMRKGEENLSPEEKALLKVMATLIEHYEERAYPIPEAPPHRVLKTLMENRGLRQKDLMHIFRSSGTASEVLSGKRPISLRQAKALGEFFHLPADVFI